LSEGIARRERGETFAVIPRPFEYHSPASLQEALSLLGKYRGDAKLLAGGQSLIPLMKLRIASPQHLIDLGRVPGLDYIKKVDGRILMGAMTRMSAVEESELLERECVLLCECAAQIADPLVRNMGTIGGNLAHADPENDMPAVMVATDAELVATGPGGVRSVAASEFFLDTFTTALAEDEVLTEIRIPVSASDGGAYVKLERQAGDLATVGVAARLRLSDGGRCEACGIGLAAAGPRVIKARRAEESLLGSKMESAALENASRLASEESSPLGDLRGSAAYKQEMVKVISKRAIALALERARRGGRG
jgi:carbon-monoxide dehydrogenase medium subunit